MIRTLIFISRSKQATHLQKVLCLQKFSSGATQLNISHLQDVESKWQHPEEAEQQNSKPWSMYRELIIPCLKTKKSKSDQFELALRFKDEMLRRGLTVTPDMYERLLLSAKERTQIIKLFNEMKQKGVQRTFPVYHHCMAICARGGQVDEVLQLLQEMKLKNYPVTLSTFNIIFNACAKGRQWDEAFHFWELMKRTGIEPDQVSYNSMIEALYDSNQKSLAIRFFVEAYQKGLYQHWSTHENFSLDLHNLTRPVALCAVSYELGKLFRSKESLEKGLRIVTGRGLNSKAEPILRTAIRKLFADLDPPLKVKNLKDNDGCLVIRQEFLDEWRARGGKYLLSRSERKPLGF